MIEIDIKKHGYIHGYTVQGHSGYAEEGSDIVCAGVSAIAQTALIGLIEVLGTKTESIVEDGFLSAWVSDPDEKTEIVLRTMLAGLKSLEEEYPEYIRIREMEE